MLIYHYNPETKIFCGITKAPVSPLEPDQYTIPSSAVLTPPPHFGPGQVPIWNDSAWSIIDSLHGATIYDVTTGEAKVFE